MIEMPLSELMKLVAKTNRHLVQITVAVCLTAIGIVGIIEGQSAVVLPMLSAGYSGMIGYEFAAQRTNGGAT